MKHLIVICILALLVSADQIKTSDACTCTQIKNENDCKAKSGCTWTAATEANGTTAATPASCGVTTTPTTPTVPTYCTSLTDPATTCAKTNGCAYVDSKCTHFTGCTAYVKTTNSDCQAISTKCITDGTQCTEAKSCNEYTTQTACEANPSISGIKKCKWDNSACRDYVCTEAASTLTTNAECSAWLSGCITTGKGCTLTLGACASYTGDDVACGGLIGTDGKCEGVANGTNCKARVCSGAANTLTTDADCSAYQVGCVTNGKGCVAAPLPACTTYSGDNTTCVGYVGSDGICEGDAGATNCRSRICANAPATNNTDALCNSYKAGCQTTGKGCVTTRGACSSYSGTTTSCVGYQGTDGYCKGTNATTPSPCAPKVCSDAPATTNTDAACATYQIGCVTTGKGCTNSLGLCSGYNGTTTSCDGYVGTDGKCKGVNANTAASCAPKVCSEAPASTTTNEACAQYQTGCVTNGAGCVALTSCLNTIKQISCTGTTGCGWNEICVASSNCSDFLTSSICLGNNAGTGSSAKPCYWTGSACRDLACTDAPNTSNTDALCNAFLAGCLSKGNGCLAPTAACSQYQGTQTTCANYTRKCWNTATATATTSCTDRTCADDTTSTSDAACNTFKAGCRTKGTGCIDAALPCSSYSGTQAQCDAFRGVNATTRCWNTSSATDTTACTVKQCSNNTTSTSDSDCEAFLTGCVTTGAGCIENTAGCSSYNGSQTQCSNFKGNKTTICWLANNTGTGQCVNKQCSHAPSTTVTDSDCEAFLTGCLTTGAGCIPKTTACTGYTGTITTCSNFTGNGKKCYNEDPCADRLCADKTTAADNTECTNYLSTCRYFNGGCTNASVCTSYTGNSLALCQDVLDNSPTPLKCWWTTGTTCTSRTCANAPSSVASQADCDSHVSGCTYSGVNTCILKAACSTYTAGGADATARATNCKAMVNASNVACWYSSGTQCEERTCANVPTPTNQASCDSHTNNACQWNGSACIVNNTCSSYVAFGSTDALMLTNCSAMKDNSNPQKSCTWTTGANCADRTCATAVTPASQANCDSHLSGCSWNQIVQPATITCQARTCSGKTGANSDSDCTSWINTCRWVGGNSCVDSNTTCGYILDSSLNTLANRQTRCLALTTTAGDACQYIIGATCSLKSCSGKTDAGNAAACTGWIASCRWIGGTATTCVDANATCAYNLDSSITAAADKATACNALTSSSGGACMYSGTGQACAVKACSGKTDAGNAAACTGWIASCRWIGGTATTCVDANATCAYNLDSSITAAADKATACNALTSSSGGACMYSGTGQACAVKACSGKTDAGNAAACTGWIASCRWIGGTATTCVDANATCAYNLDSSVTAAADKITACNALTSSSGGACMYSGTGQACAVKACSGKTDAGNAAACTGWIASCRWIGGTATTCVDANATCAYNLDSSITAAADKIAACNALTSSTGDGCVYSGTGQGCAVRTCASKTDAGNATACTGWLASCRWIGGTATTCVDANATCAYTLDSSVTAAADKITACNALTSSSGGACMYSGTGQACAVKACSGKTDAGNATACTGWIASCRWIGGTATTCVDANATCAYTLDSSITAAADKITACNALTSSSGGACMYSGTGQACAVKACSGKTDAGNAAACTGWIASCRWIGGTATTCVDANATCAYTLDSSITTAADKATACNALTSTTGGACMYSGTGQACAARTCAGKTNAASDADCTGWLTTCRWIGGTSTCVDAADCTTYQPSTTLTTNTDKITRCQTLTTASAGKCDLIYATCVAKSCANKVGPTNNSDCTSWLSTCRFDGVQCISQGTCSQYFPAGTTNEARRTICEGITNSSNVLCAYTNNGASCVDRTCTNGPTATSQTQCTSWLASCKWNGTACQDQNTCGNYSTSGVATNTNDARRIFCHTLTNNASPSVNCAYVDNATTCTDRTCANISTTPATDADCSNWLSGCKVTFASPASCLASNSVCTSFTGTAIQCKAMTGNGAPCWSEQADSAAAQSCIVRQCTHNSTGKTDAECAAFLTGCKSNGNGCVAGSTACSSFSGNATTCVLRKGSNGTSLCKVGTGVSDTCKDKSCYDDGSSTTDAQCSAFMTGCVTNGAGCIPNTEPCSSYKGIQTTCAGYTGNGKKCWNTATATATSACADKKCSDDTTSTSDTACASSLTGCVTKGAGCIEASAACSAYQGTQTTCGNFKGVNGTVLCWNISTATATTACIDKACIHNTTATTDADCDSFLPKATGSSTPKCVTKGTGCIAYPVTCSQFTGTTEQCGKFTASDGPCKSTSSTGSGACTPRICTESPNTNNTDALCKTYHPTCVTTGYGCTTAVSCSNVSDKAACTAKTGCSWVNNCRSIGTDCSSLTASGSSICMNTPVTTGTKKCAWYNNACRAQTCEDLSDSLTTHEACKAIIATCTTKGAGCVTMGACSTYSTETICKAAKTTNPGDTCIWANNACRAKQCTDATTGTTTDEGCNTWLAGCKTNGSTCISSVSCTNLITAAACIKDGSSNPCLYIGSNCYSYAKCEDITMTTHTACQAFSPQCTTDGTKCIAISSCAKTTLQVSCVTGTDGTCGWLPAAGTNSQKCQKFGACSDAVSADLATCQAYGSTCITDGTNCVAKGNCSTYTTQVACNTGGTDGTCIFSSNACRLRTCTDATTNNATSITTHDGCFAFSASTKCTTNGTSCISLGTCSSYTAEAGCVLGTDGICVFDVPAGTTTTTTKSCRLKVCQDFKLTTSAACSIALTGAGVGSGCVSNGTNCIVKSTCSTYTSKEACNGGGTDGLCAFTPSSSTTPTVGTCKLMTACSDANNDSVACNAKTAVCNWKVTTSGSTTTSACNAHDCTTKASGTTCNPVPAFDLSTYNVCIPQTGGTCALGDGTALTSTTCYGYTLGTYTWDAANSKCTACFTASNNNGGNGSGTGTNTGSTSESLVQVIMATIVLAIMFA